MILVAESEDPDQTTDAQANPGLRYVHMPSHVFAWPSPNKSKIIEDRTPSGPVNCLFNVTIDLKC